MFRVGRRGGLLWGVVAAGMGVASAASAANLLTNGGFEDAPRADIGFRYTSSSSSGEVQDYGGHRITDEQYLAGWTIDDPEVSNLIRTPYPYSLAPTWAPEGRQYMSVNWSPLGDVTLHNTISQGFTLGAGATGVAFSTFMSTESGWNQSTLQVTIADLNGDVVAQSGLFTHLGGNGVWSTQSWQTNLNPGNYVIQLSGVGNGNAWDVMVDDVQLSAIGGVSAAPEPATWGLMILGLGLAGSALRRRTQALA